MSPAHTLHLVQDTLSNNQALGVVGQDEFGGGLYNMGSATVSGSTFTNNQVLGSGSSDIIGGPSGGAIENYGGASLTVTSSLFTNNSVVSAAGLGYFANGGAINTDSGTAGSTPSTATVTSCKFLDNSALAGAQNDGNGGALNVEPGSTMTLTSSLVSGSRSVGGAGGVGVETGQGIGGGIFNDGGTMVIANSTIDDNQAVGGDDGNTTQNPWNGGGFGGGICNTGALTVSDSTISGNIVQGGANAIAPAASPMAAASRTMAEQPPQ